MEDGESERESDEFLWRGRSLTPAFLLPQLMESSEAMGIASHGLELRLMCANCGRGVRTASGERLSGRVGADGVTFVQAKKQDLKYCSRCRNYL